VILFVALLGAGAALAHDDDDDADEGGARWTAPVAPATASPGPTTSAAPAAPSAAATSDPLYARECGGCHLAYPPSLLPARSWDRLLAGLADHFGENAELAEPERKALGAWLDARAADRAPDRRGRRIAASIPPDQAPLRITEIPYIVREHRELPARAVRDNPQVKSLSRCNACHPGATAGRFDEHAVNVPGFGRWED
jgi:hypothetical protein